MRQTLLTTLASVLVLTVGVAHADVILPATLVEETYIDSASANSNFATAGGLWLGRDFSTVTRGGLLQFTLPVLPTGQLIKSVSLVGQDFTSMANDTVEIGAVAASNPNLNTITWNSAITASLMTGLTGTGNDIAWVASNVTIFTGENWTVVGSSAGQTVTYTDTTAQNGLLKFINDHISHVSPVTITLVTGPTGATNTTLFELTSSERATAVGGQAPFGPSLQIVIPEPATAGMLAGCAGALLLPRRAGSRPRFPRVVDSSAA